MTLIELIGFVIVLAAMIILMGKRAWDERQRRKYPEKYEEQQRQEEEAMREFLRSINMEGVEDQELEAAALSEPLQQPPAPPPEEFSFDTLSHIEDSMKERLEAIGDKIEKPDSYHALKQQQSRANALIQKNRHHLPSMVIMHEILGPPKALRQSPTDIF